MTTRALSVQQNALIRDFTAGSNITKGMPVKFEGADTTVEVCSSGNDAIGIALSTVLDTERVQVALYGHAIIPVLVGTGGATRGANAKLVADGFTDVTFGGGTTVGYSHGKFMESGSAADYVGLLVGGNFAGVTA